MPYHKYLCAAAASHISPRKHLADADRFCNAGSWLRRPEEYSQYSPEGKSDAVLVSMVRLQHHLMMPRSFCIAERLGCFHRVNSLVLYWLRHCPRKGGYTIWNRDHKVLPPERRVQQRLGLLVRELVVSVGLRFNCCNDRVWRGN